MLLRSPWISRRSSLDFWILSVHQAFPRFRRSPHLRLSKDPSFQLSIGHVEHTQNCSASSLNLVVLDWCLVVKGGYRPQEPWVQIPNHQSKPPTKYYLMSLAHQQQRGIRRSLCPRRDFRLVASDQLIIWQTCSAPLPGTLKLATGLRTLCSFLVRGDGPTFDSYKTTRFVSVMSRANFLSCLLQLLVTGVLPAERTGMTMASSELFALLSLPFFRARVVEIGSKEPQMVASLLIFLSNLAKLPAKPHPAWRLWPSADSTKGLQPTPQRELISTWGKLPHSFSGNHKHLGERTCGQKTQAEQNKKSSPG